MSQDIKLTLADRVLGWLHAPYKTRAMQHRAAQSFGNQSRRERTGRLDSSNYTSQPVGSLTIRKLTPGNRRVMIQQSREIYENNVLGRAMIDRAVDNIIGEGMNVRPNTGDEGFNLEVAAWWKQLNPDAAGRYSFSTLQRRWFAGYLRDGDIGGIMLNRGQVQTIESDYIQSPNNGGDVYGSRGIPEIVDGFEVGPAGRLRRAYVLSADDKGVAAWTPVDMRYFLFHANTDRFNNTAVRGVPRLAMVRGLLEQIDGTVEAVTLAHRIAAMFGAAVTKSNPGQAVNSLKLTTTNSAGDTQKKQNLEAGMIWYLGQDESISQIDPKHPTASFEQFMTTLVRFAGIALGLPLELTLMDFSKTNYSSARASMEQAYRSFRCEQRMFADSWLSKYYRWRLSKAINMGEITGTPPDRYLDHDWYAQPWPYLNPVDDAVGLQALIDTGKTTLTEELAKRGMTFDDLMAIREEENRKAAAAGVTLVRSAQTRDALPTQTQSMESNNEELPSEE